MFVEGKSLSNTSQFFNSLLRGDDINSDTSYEVGDTIPSIEDLIDEIVLTNELIWGKNVNRPQIDNWLSNFKGEVFEENYERQLAMWLLANFVYYNNSEVRHLCRTLFLKFLHVTLSNADKKQSQISKFHIQELITSTEFRHLGSPSESGAHILYYFRQEAKLPLDYFKFNYDDKESKVYEKHRIAYIDDVTITGTQASDYIDENMKPIDTGKDVYILTFISTPEARNHFIDSKVKIISCIEMDDRSKCFSSNSNCFYNHKSHMDSAKKMTFHYGKKINPIGPLGFGNGQYTFGFYYNIPDNSLPIFWSSRNGWYPIFKRYSKHEKDWGKDIGKFI